MTAPAGGPGWRGDLTDWTGGGVHAYLSCACLHGQHEQCGRLQHERGDLGAPHCKYCPAVCLCPVCRHDNAPELRPARAFHSVYGSPDRRAGQVRRVHVLREDYEPVNRNSYRAAETVPPSRQSLCGQSATGTVKADVVILDPMPATPPAGLTWCPKCIGHLAERAGLTAAFAALLAGTAVA